MLAMKIVSNFDRIPFFYSSELAIRLMSVSKLCFENRSKKTHPRIDFYS